MGIVFEFINSILILFLYFLIANKLVFCFYICFILICKDLKFPEDANKNSDLNSFIKLLLNKKVNQRVCSFSKLKTAKFLEEFSWEDLLDFKIKPPFIPEVEDYSKYLTTHLKLYEGVLRVKINFKIIIFLNFL